MADDLLLDETSSAISETLKVAINKARVEAYEAARAEIQTLREEVDHLYDAFAEKGPITQDGSFINRYTESVYKVIDKSLKEATDEKSKNSLSEIAYYYAGGAITAETPEEHSYFVRACREKARYSPFIRNIKNIIRSAVMFGPIKVDLPHEELDITISNALKKAKFNRKVPGWIENEYIDSEIFIAMFISNSGKLEFREIDAEEVTEIEYSPEDRETIFAFKREFLLENGMTEKWYPHADYFQYVKENTDYRSEHEDDFESNVFVFYFKYGYRAGQRGEIPLQPVLRYDRIYEDVLLDLARLYHERASVVWILKIKGNNQNVLNRTDQPVRGAKYKIETENKEWRIEDTKLSDFNSSDYAHPHRLAVAAGVGMPEYIVFQDISNQSFSSLRKCHSDDTQILTNNGWKFYNDISDSDLVGSVNPQSLLFEWNKINEKFIYDYTGKMLLIDARGVNLLVTPEHRLFFRTQTNDEWKKSCITDIPDQFRLMDHLIFPENTDIKTTTDSKIPSIVCDKEYDIKDILKLFAIYIGDGAAGGYKHPNRNCSLYSTRVELKKKRKIDKFIGILEKFGFHINYTKRGTYSFKYYGKEFHDFITYYCGKGALNKKIPEFVFCLSKEEKRIFFDYLIETDGYRKDKIIEFYTSSDLLSEQMYLLGIELGYRVRMRDKLKNKGAIIHCLGFYSSNNVRIKKQKNISYVDYQGKVWCVNVDNGIIVTRRNNKISINSNSDTPFGYLTQSIQNRWSENITDIIKVILREYLNLGLVSKSYKISRLPVEEIIKLFSTPNLTEAEDLKPKIKQVDVPVEDIPISVIFPKQQNDNPLLFTQSLAIMIQWKFLSRRTAAKLSGLDPDNELGLISLETYLDNQTQQSGMGKTEQPETNYDRKQDRGTV